MQLVRRSADLWWTGIFAEEYDNLARFVTQGIDQEDVDYMQKAHNYLKQNNIPGTEILHHIHWVPHCATDLSFEPAPVEKDNEPVMKQNERFDCRFSYQICGFKRFWFSADVPERKDTTRATRLTPRTKLTWRQAAVSHCNRAAALDTNENKFQFYTKAEPLRILRSLPNSKLISRITWNNFIALLFMFRLLSFVMFKIH